MITSILNKKSRIVIKIGSSLLVDNKKGLRQKWLDSLIDDIGELAEHGAEVMLVSSGAIAMGRSVLKMPNRKLKLDENQAAASVGQIELAKAWAESLKRHHLAAAQVLLTLNDTEGRGGRKTYLNARDTMSRLLKLRAIPVINENDTVATSEIQYGDNDRLAARVATMMSADLLILLSDVDGLYNAPPDRNKDAQLIENVKNITIKIENMAGKAGSGLSKGGMITKIEAAKITTQAGTAMVITSGKKNNPVSRLQMRNKATWFEPKKRKRKASDRTARKKWIAGHLRSAGDLVVDEGAARALIHNKSLLPAGVRKVEGRFVRGDVVNILTEDKRILARGLSSYSSDETRRIAGKKSTQIGRVLGQKGQTATTMVHRNDMVLLSNQKMPNKFGKRIGTRYAKKN